LTIIIQSYRYKETAEEAVAAEALKFDQDTFWSQIGTRALEEVYFR